jgi:hypothetical protein
MYTNLQLSRRVRGRPAAVFLTSACAEAFVSGKALHRIYGAEYSNHFVSLQQCQCEYIKCVKMKVREIDLQLDGTFLGEGFVVSEK